jgi:hypothetical protein
MFCPFIESLHFFYNSIGVDVVLNLKTSLLAILFALPFQTAHSSSVPIDPISCQSKFLDTDALARQLQEANPRYADAIRNEGLFIEATDAHKQHVLDAYKKWRQQRADGSGVLQDLLPVTAEDVLQPTEDSDFRAVLAEKNPFLITDKIREEINILRKHGYRNGYSGLATVVSHAGLWSRGGGDLVKALAIFNGVELFSEAEKASIIEYSRILVQAKNGVHSEAIEDARHHVKRIFYHTLQDPRAIPSQLLTLIQMAVLSASSQSYIISDSWTGPHTHKAIANYLHGLNGRIDDLIIVKDPAANAAILAALKRYVAASIELGETHVFGLQVMVKLITESAERGSHWVESSPASGEGAGLFPAYYRASGRTKYLKDRGIKSLMFRNSEVIGPIQEEYTSFRSSGRPMGYVVVEALPNDSGGNPNKRILDGLKWPLFPMLEQSNVPVGFNGGSQFFNTNTGYFNMDVLMNWDIRSVAFEPAGSNHRAKVNAMDPSLDQPSVLIQGQRPRSYTNIKEIEHLLMMGGTIVDIHTKEFIDILSHSR